MSSETASTNFDHCWWDHSAYVSLTMEFRCNLACTHCMIEGTMDWLTPRSEHVFDDILKENAKTGQWKGLILTGSEITLRKDLPELAKRARDAGFRHIRIQSHGMHLANEKFCKELFDAGVNEYFISVAAGDAAMHDFIVKREGAFEKMVRGLENLEALGALMITNTVVTRESYREITKAVEALKQFKRLVQMEFWNFFPMAEDDPKDLIVPYPELAPHLLAAIDLAREYGRRVEVKNVPECVLGDRRDALVNAQPLLEIDERFWDEFARNGFYQCAHAESCPSKECLGLTTAYIRKYGWEADYLHPIDTQETAGA